MTTLQIYQRLIPILIVVSIFFCFTFPLFANEPQTGQGEILIITSYNADSKYTYDNINSFVNTYQNLGGKALTAIENLNVNSIAEVHQWPGTITEIMDKHPKINLLILLGGEAWSGYLRLKEEKYKNIPVIFALAPRHGFAIPDKEIDIATYEPTSIDLMEKMKQFNVKACYAYEYDIDKDISLIREFYPDMEYLAFLSDNTYNGLTQQAWVKKNLKRYPDVKTTFIDGRTSTLDMAVQQVKKLPANTVLLLGIWRTDSKKTVYMNNSVYAFSHANPSLPVFSLTATGIGYWAIGGYVPQYDKVSPKIAQKAYQILDQHLLQKAEMIALPGEYKFDARKLAELGFKDKLLPANSNIINREPTFFEVYKSEMLLSLSVFLALLLGLIVSLFYYFKTKALKNNLEESALQLQADKLKLENSEVELRHAKDLAEEGSRMKSAFVSNMSHEIRTPLNAIVGFSNLLVNSIDCTEDQKEYTEIIQTNSNMLLQLISDILDVSRLESGRLSFNYEWCDIVGQCHNMITLTNQNKTTTVEVRLDSPVESYLLYTDPLRLQQIVINLLNNALKFTPDGGSIVLSFQIDERDNCVLFSVTDTGKGIPEDKQQQVFARFEKLNEFVQGTGLGLAICQLTIQHMGGDIWIDKSYKTGARFVFSHPIKKEEKPV